MNSELARQVKQFADENGRTVASVIEEALARLLAERRAGTARKPIVLPTYGAGGPLPDINFDDNSAVRDLLDEGVPIDKLR